MQDMGGQGRSALPASDVLAVLAARAPAAATPRTLLLLSDLRVRARHA
jgi:hypothetical protein